MAPTDLRDTRYFPPFDSCPLQEEMDYDFYHTLDGLRYQPTRHWCLLAEITSVARYPSLKLIATDKNGVVFPVIFSIDIEEAYLGQFTVGHTVAILYAHPRLLDRIMRMGIKQEEIKKCKVIPLPLADLFALSDRVKAAAVLVDGLKACQNCGKREQRISTCSRCGRFWYCSAACQKSGWNEKGHRGDCKVLKNNRGCFEIDWSRFDGYFTFPL